MKRSIIEDERSNAMQLSPAELQRYSRHLMMPEVTPDGQRRLKAARVLCIGAGGLDRLLHCIWPRPVWAQLGLLISTMSIFRICNGKFSTEQAPLAAVNWNLHKIGCVMPIRRSKSSYTSAVSQAQTRPNWSRSTT